MLEIKQSLQKFFSFRHFDRGSRTIKRKVRCCICFFVTGAYAAPSVNDDNEKVWKDSEILNDVLTEDGVYYIFCDGAGEDDKPLSSVSAGSIQFVLVRKDSYTSIGPFDNMKTFMEDVTKQCGSMKSITREEKELVIKTAAGISEHSASYEKLMAYKTENYPQQSITDFKETLAPTPDELTEFLAIVADVGGTISH